jgi:hypothetical protein
MLAIVELIAGLIDLACGLFGNGDAVKREWEAMEQRLSRVEIQDMPVLHSDQADSAKG